MIPVYKVSLSEGIVEFEATQRKYGWLTLPDGSKIRDSGYYYSKESAERALERKIAKSQQSRQPEKPIEFNERELYFWQEYLSGSTIHEASVKINLSDLRGRQILEKTIRKIQKLRDANNEPKLSRTELRNLQWQIPENHHKKPHAANP